MWGNLNFQKQMSLLTQHNITKVYGYLGWKWIKNKDVLLHTFLKFNHSKGEQT